MNFAFDVITVGETMVSFDPNLRPRLWSGRDAMAAHLNRLEGLSWPATLARANWIGAQAVQVVGDIEGLPRRDELPAGL